MSRLFISATGTGIGKTLAAQHLIRTFAGLGKRVGVCKPIETGVENFPRDATLLLGEAQRHNPNFRKFTPGDITAYTFPLPAAPFCADREQSIRIPKIMERIETLERECDLLIVEGAGGLMVPILADYFMIDLARELEAFTLLVTPSRLGCINETLLSLEALEERGIPHDWCVNLYEEADDFARVTRPFYDAAFPGWWSLQGGMERFAESLLSLLEKEEGKA